MDLASRMIARRRVLARWLFAGAVGAMLANSAVFVSTLSRLNDAEQAVRHTLQVQQQVGAVLTALINAETGERGYLLTSDNRYLSPFHQAFVQIDAGLSSLRREVADNPSQLARIDDLDKLIDSKMEELTSIIKVHADGDPARALEMVRADVGLRIMDRIRLVVAAMDDEEAQLLREREFEQLLVRAGTYVSAAGFVVLALILLVALLLYNQRQMRERTEAAAEIERYAKTLDANLKSIEGERNEIVALNDASSLLQSCKDVAEFSQAVGPLMQALLPGTSGELSMIAASRNQMRHLVAWGGWQAGQPFAPDDCWAMRRGQPHGHVEGGGAAPAARILAVMRRAPAFAYL